MFLLLSFLLLFSEAPNLQIEFTNVQKPVGKLYIAVFDNKADFLQPQKARYKKIFPLRTAKKVKVVMPDIPAGTYAISCFHDVNNNGILDKNWMGIPKEPYCFSNNARPRFRAPNWEETKFRHKSGQKEQALRLEKW